MSGTGNRGKMKREDESSPGARDSAAAKHGFNFFRSFAAKKTIANAGEYQGSGKLVTPKTSCFSEIAKRKVSWSLPKAKRKKQTKKDYFWYDTSSGSVGGSATVSDLKTAIRRDMTQIPSICGGSLAPPPTKLLAPSASPSGNKPVLSICGGGPPPLEHLDHGTQPGPAD